MKITNKEISQKLTDRKLKHSDLASVIQAVSEIESRHQEVESWNNLTNKEKEDYFYACQTAAYKKELAENYKITHGFDKYEELQLQLGGKSLEDAKITSTLVPNLNTTIALANAARLAEEDLLKFRKINLDKSQIKKRAEEFIAWRENAKITGDWS